MTDLNQHGLVLDFYEPAKQVADGDKVLDAVMAFVSRFVSLSESQAAVIALWIAMTFCFTCWQIIAYLLITSAEKRCGKSRLLEVLQLLVHKPWRTGRTSVAVLIRKVASQHPTCLLDEMDAAFKSGDEYQEALRGILNCGFQKGNPASLCVGQGAKMELVDFDVFGPKAFAGIGKFPDTIADRSIPIRLKRQSQAGKVERFRIREVRPQSEPIRANISTWVNGCREELGAARPKFPTGLTDRQEDVCEALLAIADQAGGRWPELARRSLLDIFGGAAAEDESTGVKLLVDIKAIFEELGVTSIPTVDLITRLGEIETSP